MTTRADEIIRSLALAPHPEGGFYREFFRAGATVTPVDGRGARAALSTIYFLLCAGDASRWHSVRSDEQWTFLEGAPVELFVLDRSSFRLKTHRLGAADGGVATVVVPAGAWQAARAPDGYALVTCTVGPGFEFDDFSFMADDAEASERLRRESPMLARLL
jgi:predicted cupin superfamily sugar epimerase